MGHARVRAALAALGAGTLTVVASAGGAGEAAGNGLADRTPDQVLAAVRGALRQVRSFHVEVHSVDRTGTTVVEGDVELPGQIHLTGGQGSERVEMVVVGGKAYVKANASFYDHNGGGAASTLLADRWVILPPDAGATSLEDLEAIADPSTLADCLVGGAHGTLTRAGTGLVSATPVVIIEDRGNVPGDAPGRLSVATQGPAYPVRAQQTGPRTPGGAGSPACGGSGDGATSSDMFISAVNRPVTITAPRDVIDLAELARQGP